MRRSTRSAFAIPLLALIGCGNPADPADGPGLGEERPQYGPPAGTDESPGTEAESDHPALSDPGQPPDEEGVPSGAGGNVDLDQGPGSFSINPPRDLEESPADPEPPAEASEAPLP